MNSERPLVYTAGRFDPNIIGMFYDLGYRGTSDLMLADLVVFTGGEDIDPVLYGEEPIPQCGHLNQRRDQHEVEVFNNAKNFQIPMLGICRGAQFLNVMNGGKLWQHVDNHTMSHAAKCLLTGEIITVTSTHHQMMRPPDHADLVMIAHHEDKRDTPSLCTRKMAEGITQYPSLADCDPEVVWFEDTKTLCVQFHPEYGSAKDTCRPYFIRLMNNFFPREEKPICADS